MLSEHHLVCIPFVTVPHFVCLSVTDSCCVCPLYEVYLIPMQLMLLRAIVILSHTIAVCQPEWSSVQPRPVRGSD